MSDLQTRHRLYTAAVLALGLAILACSAPSASGQPTQVVDLTSTTTAEVTTQPTTVPPSPQPAGPSPVPQGPTATAGASPVPPATTGPGQPTSPPLTGGGTADYEGISFYFFYALSSKWEVATIPSDPPNSGAPQNWLVATHYEFTFPGYPVSNPQQAPRILIFPVAAWQNYNPTAEQRIPALQKLLTDKPTSFGENEEIPLLPVFNAAQVFRGHVSYLGFKNGSGVRFITQYDQAPIPFNNQELFYTFQGLTADGKYYVSAFFPITHPSLPADSSNPDPKVLSDFLAYKAATVQALEAATDGSFYPDLHTLDTMIQSLKVK